MHGPLNKTGISNGSLYDNNSNIWAWNRENENSAILTRLVVNAIFILGVNTVTVMEPFDGQEIRNPSYRSSSRLRSKNISLQKPCGKYPVFQISFMERRRLACVVDVYFCCQPNTIECNAIHNDVVTCTIWIMVSAQTLRGRSDNSCKWRGCPGGWGVQVSRNCPIMYLKQ